MQGANLVANDRRSQATSSNVRRPNTPGQSNMELRSASPGDAVRSPSKQLVAGSIPARRAGKWLFFELNIAVTVLNVRYCLEAVPPFGAFARVCDV